MKVFNTLTRKKEEFVPLEPGKVKLYACGPTVYNFIHIGNARPLCLFDVLRRYLEYRGLEVTVVQNFTDIDDKIIKKANEEGTDYRTVSERYIAEYKTDAAGLGVREATIHPKATETIPEIIELVREIVDNGYGSVLDGSVYFRSRRFREAESPAPGGAGCRQPPRAGHRQGGWPGLCPLEGRQARGAQLGVPLGPGTPRLAHRVHRHDSEAPGGAGH